MTLLVFSDSHGYSATMMKIIDMAGDVDGVCHLGDGAADLARVRGRLPVYAVRGNCDGGCALPSELTVDPPAGKLFLTHGHLYSVKTGLDRLAGAACAKGAAACLFGHTHNPAVTVTAGILLVNPGSAAFPKEMDYPTYGVVECREEGVFTKIIEVTPYGLRPFI
jgi:putative phosphoesterase